MTWAIRWDLFFRSAQIWPCAPRQLTSLESSRCLHVPVLESPNHPRTAQKAWLWSTKGQSKPYLHEMLIGFLSTLPNVVQYMHHNFWRRLISDFPMTPFSPSSLPSPLTSLLSLLSSHLSPLSSHLSPLSSLRSSCLLISMCFGTLLLTWMLEHSHFNSSLNSYCFICRFSLLFWMVLGGSGCFWMQWLWVFVGGCGSFWIVPVTVIILFVGFHCCSQSTLPSCINACFKVNHWVYVFHFFVIKRLLSLANGKWGYLEGFR